MKDDVYTRPILSAELPKFSFPQNESDPATVYQAMHDELMMDGNARQNLATFCQTWLDPEIHKLMDESIDKNMIDKDEYPQTAEMEARCVHMLADLWHSPDAQNTMGCSTTGSSEAAMLGGLAMKWRWREKMKKLGKPTDKPNLVVGPVQVCWLKFARYWDVEIREIPLDGENLGMTPDVVTKYCDENTIGVVPTLGVTYTCQFEPVEAICKALDDYQAKTGIDIPVHVDGASGGFLAPFIYPDLTWDFKLARVKSINTSGHKFGLAPLGVGWVVWREKTDLPDGLIFWVNYLGGNMPTFALNFSRPGGQIVAQYYNLVRLGREGYRKIHQACYDTAQMLADKIDAMGPFKVLYNGRGGIPALSWSLKGGSNPDFSLYDLAEKLRARGWQVPAYSMPPHREDLIVMRILVRHGFSGDMANLFLEDLQRSLGYFKKHPVSNKLTAGEANSHNHTGR